MSNRKCSGYLQTHLCIGAAAAVIALCPVPSHAQAKPDIGKIRQITTSTERDQQVVAIRGEKPLVYSYYKTVEPAKAVIDLAYADAAEVASPIAVNTGLVKSISVTPRTVAGAPFARIEIELEKDADFAVKPDPVEKRLNVVFTVPVSTKVQEKATPGADVAAAAERKESAAPDAEPVRPAEKVATAPAIEPPAAPAPVAGVHAANVQAAAAPAAEPAVQAQQARVAAVPAVEPAPLVPANTETQPSRQQPTTPAGEPASVPVSKPAAAVVSAQATTAEHGKQAAVLKEVAMDRENLLIRCDNLPKDVKVFRMQSPERLVVDLPGARSAVNSPKIELHNAVVSSARVGITPDHVRVVFDGSAEAFSAHKVTQTPEGLAIQLGKPMSVVKEAPSVEPKRVERAPNGIGTVQNLDFAVADNVSRITVKTSGGCEPGEPVAVPSGYMVTLKNCLLPKKLQRPLDTSRFPGLVTNVTPYEVREKGRTDTRVLVKASRSGKLKMHREPDMLRIEMDVPATVAEKRPAELPVSIPEETPEKPAVVAAAPKAPAAAPAQAAAAREQKRAETVAVKVQEEPKVEPARKAYTGRRVTLEFVDAEVRKIFQLIAEVSNLNFLIGDDVGGTISIKLINVPWDQALDVILESKGLGMKREGQIVQIKPKTKIISAEDEEIAAKKAREKAMELYTEVFNINFATVGDVAGQFKAIGSGRSDSSITSDTRTNKVIVTDIAPALARMRTLLETLDVPERQVMIEARIVEASTVFTRDLGVQWGIHYWDASAPHGVRDFDAGFGGVVSTAPSSGTSGPGLATGISFGTLPSNLKIDLRLSAAASAGQVKIISTPRVATLNNKTAKISQGQQIPYQNTTSQSGAVTQFVEAALTLDVTPHINANGTIVMKVKASNNTPGSSTGSAGPAINTKEATTELIVRDGETTVIGGIYVDSDAEGRQGVPFLMDIPLLGHLFKSTSKTKTKSELLIFITPKILNV